MKIAIIGTGYVGLPTGAGFASLGMDVVCVDKIPEIKLHIRAVENLSQNFSR
jgi:UDP-glucose 6-dehydrogenase